MFQIKVLVLLSSWNGQDFILDQLTSILYQEIDANLQILVRDDGSIDDTVTIIRQLKHPSIEIIEGENWGAKASFLYLIKEAEKYDADFIALADQDDVWEPQKLRAAIEKLMPIERPGLYCSSLTLVDQHLEPIGIYIADENMQFKDAVFCNVATGCTCVFNRKLLNKINQPDTRKILMHDWWLYLVATAFGDVIYDHSAQIMYRQHASNQIGLKTGLASYLHRFIKLINRPSEPNRLTQAQEFLRLYGNQLSLDQQDFLIKLRECSESFLKRIYFAFRCRPSRKKMIDNFIGLMVFILGK